MFLNKKTIKLEDPHPVDATQLNETPKSHSVAPHKPGGLRSKGSESSSQERAKPGRRFSSTRETQGRQKKQTIVPKVDTINEEADDNLPSDDSDTEVAK